MANEMMTFTGENDAVVTPITFNGDVYFIAKDIGAALGYADDGSKLAKNILQRWGDEFIEGTDFVVLTGKNLSKFKATAEQGTDSVPCSEDVVGKRARSLLVLTESGVNLVCMKTNKPIGVALRRWLAEVLLPALRRGDMQAVAQAASLSPAESIALERERRLLERERRLSKKLDDDRAKAKAAALAALAADDTLTLDPAARQALKVRAAQFVVGEDLGHLAIASDERLYTATQVADALTKELGTEISIQRIGLTITGLNLRGDDRFTRQVMDVTPQGKTVPANRLTDEGARVVKVAVRNWHSKKTGGSDLERARAAREKPPAQQGLDHAGDV